MTGTRDKLLHFIRNETQPVIPLRMTMRQGNPEENNTGLPNQETMSQ